MFLELEEFFFKPYITRSSKRQKEKPTATILFAKAFSLINFIYIDYKMSIRAMDWKKDDRKTGFNI